jgi:hypothetical protein
MNAVEGPVSAGPSCAFRACLGVLAMLVFLLAGCANTFADDAQPQRSPDPLPGLSERPAGAPLPVAGAPTTLPESSVSTAPSSPTTNAGNKPATALRGRVDVRVDDPSGDAGLGAPAYADGRLLSVEDLGERVRVTVQVSATVPAKLKTEEVIGIGVDFFRSGGTESDYQLFADGGSDGWRAFLETPDGFVRYPGSFRLGGDSVQFEVAWADLGGPPKGSISAFVDWGEPKVAGLITRTEDLLPDGGRAALTGR